MSEGGQCPPQPRLSHAPVPLMCWAVSPSLSVDFAAPIPGCNAVCQQALYGVPVEVSEVKVPLVLEMKPLTSILHYSACMAIRIILLGAN